MAQIGDDERDLLLELAKGKKTFDQVSTDAQRLCRRGADLSALCGSNPSRSIAGRLLQVTGISKDSLNFFPVRCKAMAADPHLSGNVMRLPFILLSTHIKQLLAKDPYYFEVEMRPQKEGVAASDFLKSREYINHGLVQASYPLGETVIPVGLYCDGIAVGADPHADSLYVVYLYFLHRPAEEAGRPESKFVFTVFRKSESTDATANDIWSILLWELQALQFGRLPVLGQEGKPLHAQEGGDFVEGRWGRWHKICLMQIKGDWSWYCEAMGIWQWNCVAYMCPFCAAHGKGPLTWKDFSFDAPWRSTCRTHARFLADMNESKRQRFKIGRSPFKSESLLTLAPFFSWTMLKLDWMHAADLGVLVYVLGEVFWSLLPMLAGAGGRPTIAVRERGLMELKQRLRAYYKTSRVTNRLPVKRLTLGKIKSRTEPKLKAKAAQAKDLLQFAVALAQEFKEDGSDVARSRCHAMEELAAMYALVRQHEVSADELMAWRAHAAMFAFHYASCHFKFYPKFHCLMHTPEQVEQSGVLRSFWVYAEESKNRQLKTLFNVCSKGAGVHQQILLRLQWLHALLALE